MHEATAKTCQVCGRAIEPRRMWRETLDQIRSCSARCRRQRLRPVDQQLEAAILELLAARPHGASIRNPGGVGWRPPGRRPAG